MNTDMFIVEHLSIFLKKSENGMPRIAAYHVNIVCFIHIICIGLQSCMGSFFVVHLFVAESQLDFQQDQF